jgi:hypothetical protein
MGGWFSSPRDSPRDTTWEEVSVQLKATVPSNFVVLSIKSTYDSNSEKQKRDMEIVLLTNEQEISILNGFGNGHFLHSVKNLRERVEQGGIWLANYDFYIWKSMTERFGDATDLKWLGIHRYELGREYPNGVKRDDLFWIFAALRLLKHRLEGTVSPSEQAGREAMEKQGIQFAPNEIVEKVMKTLQDAIDAGERAGAAHFAELKNEYNLRIRA